VILALDYMTNYTRQNVAVNSSKSLS